MFDEEILSHHHQIHHLDIKQYLLFYDTLFSLDHFKYRGEIYILDLNYILKLELIPYNK